MVRPSSILLFLLSSSDMIGLCFLVPSLLLARAVLCVMRAYGPDMNSKTQIVIAGLF